ncbi:MAG: ATP-dependent DNA helicase RecG [Armatimonadetes bacterium]|nr:ATP-dependent DNA helicase RecG [Armatimonadota bacterium]
MSDTQTETRKSGQEMEVQFLKGVGPKLAMMLRKVGIETVGDVLFYFPRRYEDRTKLPPLFQLSPGEAQTVRGRLLNVSSRPTRGGKVLIRAILDDGSGQVGLIWFNQPWVGRELQKIEGEIIAYGTVKHGQNRMLEISSPEWEPVEDDDDEEQFARLMPVYPLKEGVPQWLIRKAAKSAIEYFSRDIEDPLPVQVLKEEHLRDLKWCLRQMHLPDSERDQFEARKRLVFEEFLYLQLAQQMRRREVKQEVGISFPISEIGSIEASDASLFVDSEAAKRDVWEQIHAMLPFDLTGAQKRVIGEIFEDMERSAPMNRLVQGDVGSGKTAVAACAMLASVRCGYQTALMAPTEILAEQHAYNLKKLFEPLGITVTLLVGKQTAAQKKKALQATASGEAQIAVGTHALIQDGVDFHKLGLVIVDEQHRFGVMQRLALRQKGVGNPDVLVMTATPIPRTMTMTLYGDLDLSVIDELPPGRKPIKTHWKRTQDRDKVYGTVRELIGQGRQAYFVCPLITESPKMEVQAAEDLHYRLSNEQYPDLNVGLLHGQLKPVEKEEIMEAFRRNELHILVSTVVIEVGVDVPNATVMVIEDANRFGLSQLHQLRGRVGRGEHQSFCILIADATTEEARERLEIMVETSNGFRIAEKDLEIRGPGDFAGTKQSGFLNLKLANLVDDGPMLEQARAAANRILDRDPGLLLTENEKMLSEVRKQRSQEALVVVS